MLAPAGVLIAQKAVDSTIVLNLSATENLNYYMGSANAIVLVLYQLKSDKGLDNIIEGEFGADVLLKAEAYNEEVLDVRKLYLNPKDRRQLMLTKQSEANYLLAVAGYNNASPKQSVKILKLQSDEQRYFWQPKNMSGSVLNMVLGKEGLR